MVTFKLNFRVPTLKTLPVLTSFIGAMDLKIGVNIISLFGLLNKVAGVYGIMAFFSGGSVEQLTMYIYSLSSIAVILWGLKNVSEEAGHKVLLYAHLYALDHLISTVYTVLFAVNWYVYVPHDGRRVAYSDAQKEMMAENGNSTTTAAETKAAAEAIWKSERGFAGSVLVLGWLIKIYFIYCIYSFAIHLQRGTYHSLPLSKPIVTANRPSYNHTRHSSTGGPRYSHLRNISMATDTSSVVETLWEEGDEDLAMEEGYAK